MAEPCVARCPPIKDFDVVVAGGGPAGSSTAICCSALGMKVMLLEQGPRGRHKACGGILPLVAPEVIEDIVGASIPEEVRADPPELGLLYVPPSGRTNAGRVRNYRIHNIKRDEFDLWLLGLAEDAGVDIRYETRVEEVRTSARNEIIARGSDGELRIGSRFVVGADGVRSTIRKILFPEMNAPVMIVGQEHWDATGDFENSFYGFFRGDISISYAYLIPKRDKYIIGLGVVPHQTPNIAEALKKLRQWLSDEFSFDPNRLLETEVWAIPFGYFTPGKDNVLLVGDAAGLCNPLSGEGIRLAVESGEAACTAIANVQSGRTAVENYEKEVKGIADMVKELNAFVRGANDASREKFVQEELSRGSGLA